MGVTLLLCGLWFLYRVRDSRFVSDLVASTPLSLVLSLAVFVSVLRGLMQRGLRFDPSDVEYLFGGPFSERALLIYRLVPSYLSACCVGLLIFVFFRDHFGKPFLSTACLIMLHVLSIHLTTIASLFAGTLSESERSRLRKGFCFLGGAILLIIIRSQLIESGSVTNEVSPWRGAIRETGFWFLSDPGASARWALRLAESATSLTTVIAIPKPEMMLFVGSLVLMSLTLWSLSLLMRFRSAIIEPNVAGATGLSGRVRFQSAGGSRFRGAKALVWKNLVCVRRSVPSLLLALGGTLLVTVPWLLILLMMHRAESFDPWAVNGALPLTLAALPLLLQTTMPFDFRLDGHQLSLLKRFPLGDISLVLGVLGVPVALCVGFQYLGLSLFLWMAPFDWGILIAMVLGFPAVSLGVAAVWNLHYLLFAVQRFGNVGRPTHRSTIGALIVVGIAFGVFFPSCWLLHVLIHRFDMPGVPAAFAALFLQYAVDVLLVYLLAKIYSRSNVIGGQAVL